MPGEGVLLNEAWAAFRRAGITDDLRIIEAVAALLLEQEGIPLGDGLPRRAQANDLDEAFIRGRLQQASEAADGSGNLLDRHVLFRLPDMRAGGQYPTPRHIARLMNTLAETSEQGVADFACGSAGLLVYSEGSTVIGIEISPEWARIARANLRLHQLQGEVREGNALRVVNPDESFARIVMNPPFGAKVTSDFGGRSETALIYLALEHLAEGGRAAVLAPSGLLFSGSRHETQLRQRLIDEVTLEAVITLPEDSFQPYSTLTTHLLLVEKTPPGADSQTWFLRPVYDGYISGRGRNLTEDPKTPNDLTLVEKSVTAIRQKPDVAGEFPFMAQLLLDENGGLLGVAVYPSPEATLLSARHLPEEKDQDGQVSNPASLLLEIQRENRREFWQSTLEVDAVPESVQDAETLISTRLGVKKKEIPPPDVFQNQSIRWGGAETRRVDGILVKAFGAEKPQLMGVAIPRFALQARGFALQPDDYLRAPEISAELVRPHEILLELHKRQQSFSQQMERLAGWLTPEAPKTRIIPSPVDIEQPFGALSEIQQKIWQGIAAKVEDGSARPFTPEDIQVEGGESEKRLALEIFEAMGLIVPITLKNLKNEQPMNFYRLAEQTDRWAGVEVEQA